MFGLFKKENLTIEQLNEKYKDCLMKWCKHEKTFFFPIRFEYHKHNICIVFKHEDGHVSRESVLPFSEFPYDLIQSRANYIVFKNRLERLGLKIVPINERRK